MPLDSVLSPRVLVLASRYDFSCDYVASSLRSSQVPYFRLNTEDLPQFELTLDPFAPCLRGVSSELTFEIRGDRLGAVYFRQPTFLREASLNGRPPTEQFQRAQWAAFMRTMMVFDRCLWVNHPARTYEAEHKAVQLRAAAHLGFDVPRTRISNSTGAIDLIANGADRIVVKGLDTVLVRDGRSEVFGYTNLLQPGDLSRNELNSAPTILQEAIADKLDLRVTVVGDMAWCAAVTVKGKPIVGDWRLAKTDAEFNEFCLPEPIVRHCVALTKHLGLTFGAIDLAFSEGKYFFLEINPTGEWAWLQVGLGFPIASGICQTLIAGVSDCPSKP